MNLVLRADAGVAIGTGHVMRCLALAQAWQDLGGRAVFAVAECTPAIHDRLLSDSCEIRIISAEAGAQEDFQQTIGLAREQQAEWVVVDGYEFSAEYQYALKSAGCKVLFVDDYGHAKNYSADLILNQNPHASDAMYGSRESYTRLLLGPSYSMLRREFKSWQAWKRTVAPAGRNVLVTMGGSDPENFTSVVVKALRSLPKLEATVVVGGSNPHYDSLQQGTSRDSAWLRLRRSVPNMPELMAWADVAVSAAGSTCWELCFLALPALLIDVAANQTAVARDLHRLGCAVHLGSAHDISGERLGREIEQILASTEQRQTLSRRSGQLVDGNGARRVASALRGGDCVNLRRAQENDSRLLWEWANDPEVRAASFSPLPIPWESHVSWLSGKLYGDKCLIWIAEDAKATPFGQIRFDVKDDGDCEVDVSIARAKRGQGLASTLIKLGVETFTKQRDCPRVHAFVKVENIASIRSFEKANFRQVGAEQLRGYDTVHLIYERG